MGLSPRVMCLDFSSFRLAKIEYVFDFHEYKCNHIVCVECGGLLSAALANDDQFSKFND